MQLHIYGPWRKSEEEAAEDRKHFCNLFQLQHSHGLESRMDYDDEGKKAGRIFRADCNIEESDYSIHGSQKK
jgi:hypothetical protein